MITRGQKAIGTGRTVLAVLCVVAMCGIRPAQAQYTDPGSSAMLLQIIGATVFSMIFYFGVVKRWISKKLGRSIDVGAGAAEKEPVAKGSESV